MIDWLRKNKERLTKLFAEFGTIAIVLWFGIFLVTIVVIYVGLELGFDLPGGTTGGVGKLGAAYVGAQILKPLRVVLTLALTPVAAGLKERFLPSASSLESEID